MQAVDLAIQIQFIAILVIDFCCVGGSIITAAATADNTTTFFILYALFVLFLDFPQNLLAELSRTISLTITLR
ncbi:hypothetical protein I3G64_001949 [Salmonella enterica]|nr:hypothetical protein [Salmonella enterica]